MIDYGFVKVAAAAPMVKVADCKYNREEIFKLIQQADEQNVSVVLFPELCITGYTCGDLFNQNLLIEKAKESLLWLCEQTKSFSTVFILGLPMLLEGRLYNVAAVVGRGQIFGIVPKVFLPNYGEFYEKRWFSGAVDLKNNYVRLQGKNFNQEVFVSDTVIFQMHEMSFAIEICEDLWTAVPPSGFHALHGADVIFNLSASNETIGKHTYRKALVQQQSSRCFAGYVYASVSSGESTTDIVYAGTTLIAENGIMLAEGERYTFDSQLVFADIDIDMLRQERMRNKSFSISKYKDFNIPEYTFLSVDKVWKSQQKKNFKLARSFSTTPFVSEIEEERIRDCEDAFSIQTNALAKRMLHVGCQNVVLGVSGGLDSTLALLVVVNVYDKLKINRKHILGITMPGFGTSNRTYENALKLMNLLGITVKEIDIKDSVLQHFKTIDHDPKVHDVVYENAQARIRTQVLMDYANKINGLVIGTGDLSELALGWCTYNGDHMSMYGVNASVPKTLVRDLTRNIADSKFKGQEIQTVLHDIVDTPVSPELLPADEVGNIAQITEDVIGPYALHDFFLYYVLRYGFRPAKVYFLATHAFKEEYSGEEILSCMKIFYKRFFNNQFKRSCLPDGPKVGAISLSPRGDWKMPSDASYSLWMEELDAIEINNTK